MIRSNSSQGSFMPQSPLLTRLSPRGNVSHHHRERRSNKDMQPPSSLAHIDFPPPPNDLPPPPDDFIETNPSSVGMESFPPPPDGEILLPSSASPDGGKTKHLSTSKHQSPHSRRRDYAPPYRSSSSKGMSDPAQCSHRPDDSAGSPQAEGAPFAVTRRKLKDSTASDSKKPTVKIKSHGSTSLDSCDGLSDGSPASRFGVNLRHRDQSSDSCDSVKSLDNLSPRSATGGAKSNWSLSRSAGGSSSADTVETPPSPVNAEDLNGREPEGLSVASFPSNDNLNSENVPDSHQAGQLVTELFESLRQRTGPPPTDNGSVKNLGKAPPVNPAESPGSLLSNLKKAKSSSGKNEDHYHSNIDFKAKLRKTEQPKQTVDVLGGNEADGSHIIDFRSQLRKTRREDNRRENGTASKDSCAHTNGGNESYEDGRSAKNTQDRQSSIDSPHGKTLGKRDSANSSDSLKLEDDEDDYKRFSSSSINNLKKLWEKEERERNSLARPSDPQTLNQTSPKYASGLYRKPEGIFNKDQPKSSSEEVMKSSATKLRAWPPSHRSDDLPPAINKPIPADGKPVIPTKPSGVKNLRPPPPSGGGIKPPPPKPAGIYATPSFISQSTSSSKKDRKTLEFKSRSKSDGKDHEKKKSTKVSSASKKEASGSYNTNNTSDSEDTDANCPPDRSRMLEETRSIEAAVLKTLSADTPLSSTACIQLVLRLEQFQVWCVSYVDHMPPQNRFQVREMISRLDEEVRNLRVKGGGKSPEHKSSVGKAAKGGAVQFPQLVATVRDICNTLRR